VKQETDLAYAVQKRFAQMTLKVTQGHRSSNGAV